MESLLVDSLKRTGSEAMWLTPRQKEQESLLLGRSSAIKSTEKWKNSENHCFQGVVALKKALKKGKIAKIIAFKAW